MSVKEKIFNFIKKRREKRFVKTLRKRNQNLDFTLITNNCIGGVIYHNLGLKFLSPTVNLFIRGEEYLAFCKDLNYYKTLSLSKVESKEPFPVGRLIPTDNKHIPVTVYFKHYKSFEEAVSKWQERFDRINLKNIFFIWEFYDNLYDENLAKEFDKLPVKKMVLTHRYIDGIDNQFVLSCYKDKIEDGKSLKYDGMTGKRYLDEFDYVTFLNEK